MLKSILDLQLKILEIAHVSLDLIKWQFDEHTSNLWRLIVSDELLHVWIDAVANLTLQVRVVGLDGWKQSNGILLILLCDSHLGGVHGSLVLHGHWLLWLLLHWNWWRLNHSLLSMRHLLLAWLHHLMRRLLSWLHHLLLLLGTWVHLLLNGTDLVAWVLSSHASWVVSVSWVLVLIHLLSGLLVNLNDTEQLLEHLSQVRLGGQVIPLEASSLLGLVLLPVSLVLSCFHVELSNLLDLVVVDDQHLSFAVVILQNLLSLSGIGWLLVANESISISGVVLVANLDLLDLSELTEKIFEVLFTPALGEVFDEQVASLL